MVTIPFAALVVLMDEHRDAILINPVKSFNTQVSHPPALKGQKLLAQGVWGKTCETSVKISKGSWVAVSHYCRATQVVQ